MSKCRRQLFSYFSFSFPNQSLLFVRQVPGCQDNVSLEKKSWMFHLLDYASLGWRVPERYLQTLDYIKILNVSRHNILVQLYARGYAYTVLPNLSQHSSVCPKGSGHIVQWRVNKGTRHRGDALSQGSNVPNGKFRDTLLGNTSSRHRFHQAVSTTNRTKLSLLRTFSTLKIVLHCSVSLFSNFSVETTSLQVHNVTSWQNVTF